MRDGWNIVSKRVYWDREVSLERWRDRISVGHRSYLPDAVATMTPAEFVRFYGLSGFRRDWPGIRAKLKGCASPPVPCGVFDLAWSQVMGGGWNLRPTEDFFSIPEKRRAFLVQVALHPGTSIYAAAKALGFQYRRAHDHAARLSADGKIRVVETIEHGRRRSKLFPV